MKPASLVATIALAIISLLHLVRLVFQIPVTAGGIVIPLWLSAVACLFAGGLAVMLWRERGGN